MPQVELTWGMATHIGQREEQQDRCLAVPPLFVVADGMGGHAAGAAASEAAVTRLASIAGGMTVDVGAVQEALDEADEEIRNLGGPGSPPLGAGTTVAGVALTQNGDGVLWAAFHIGDSRIYRWSPDSWERISTDHSLVQELLDGGNISADEIADHPMRHIITRALGVGSGSEADFTLLPVEGSERFLICSDGLTGELDDARLGELMSADAGPDVVAGRLVDEAVAAGARDNVTVVVVQVAVQEGADGGAGGGRDAEPAPVG